MIHIDVESILQNSEAFQILEEGGHPTEFFAHLNMSVEHHMTLYHENPEYKSAFDVACTKAISILKAYAREMFCPTAPKKEKTPYQEIYDLDQPPKKKVRLNEEFQIYKHYVEDIESYMPAIKRLRTEVYVPSTPEEERTFYITYAPSAQANEEKPLDAAPNTST